jgi:hypothetical protein
MGATILVALVGLIGIALGGGVRAWEASLARRREAEAVLSALCAEVEAINRLANHRQFLAGFHEHRAMNFNLVSSGFGQKPGHWLVIELSENYFSTYDALNSNLGLLHPYFADRITRFYTYAKAVTENYRMSSPFQNGITADLAVQALDNDILLLETMHVLGIHIATFRQVAPPPGIVDPFPVIAGAESEAQQKELAEASEPVPPPS